MAMTAEPRSSLGGTFRTADFRMASHALERFYVPHDLKAASKRRFELDSILVTAGNVRVGQLKFGTDVSVDCEADTSGFVLSYATEGVVEVSSRGEEATAAPTRATLLSPERTARFDIPEDATLVTLSFRRGDVEAELSAMLRRRIVQPITFDFECDVGAGPGANLLATSELFRRQVTGADNLVAQYPEHTAYATSLARAAINALLLTLPHNYSDELRGKGNMKPMPSAIVRAVQAVNDDPTAIHRATDLARIAALSLRALEADFERYVGEPPMTYVRRVRLDCARAQLLAGNPHTTTVAEVANRWAFYHLGRFSATYRVTFGENPSATLSRGNPESVDTSNWLILPVRASR